MIRVKEISLNTQDKTADVSLFSDTKSEVTPNAEIVGLPSGYTIAQGSSVITASAELAFMKSDGSWSWV
jgi:hypothetical protein